MFNLLTTCYLFLGGAGAGALALLSALELARVTGWRALAVPDELFARSWPVCVVTLALGVLCLLADVGRPDRLLAFLTSPVPTPLTVGAYALAVAFALACAFTALALLDGRRPPVVAVAALAVAGLVAGVAVAAYTGVLLQGLASVLFWQTPLLPAVFVLSSASCGVGCVFLGAAFVEARRPFVRSLARLAWVDGVLIAAETLCLAAYLAWALAGDGTRLAAQALIAGDLRWWFWGGVVVCGLAVPFALERFLTHGNSRTQLLWIAAALLAGGFVLRFVMVGAAAYDVTQMPGALFGLAIG